jgi:hypothetical protein
VGDHLGAAVADPQDYAHEASVAPRTREVTAPRPVR